MTEKRLKMEDVFKGYRNMRLLVMLECVDRTHFHQVLLTSEQYRKLAKMISKPCTNPDHDHSNLKEGYEMREMKLRLKDDVDADAFIGMESHYTAREIKKIEEEE